MIFPITFVPYCIHSFILLAAPPKFGGDIKEKLTLNVGASHVLELPFSANPAPRARWTFNDGRLPDTRRFRSQTVSGMTSLTMTSVAQKDAGYYRVTLENEHGHASSTVKLTVLGMI